MLTLFTIPKAFRGHIAVIQRNAIRSWTLLRPACEIILFGDDEGVPQAAAELAVRHIPKVERNEFGTPLVHGLFARAESAARYDLLCYVNADIILMSDLMSALARVVRRRRRFLVVGRRWDVDIKEPLDLGDQWEERLRRRVGASGQLHPPGGVDYFAFSRGLWQAIPPFAIGRTTWDNWLIYGARARGAAVIDATAAVMAVHQNHDYAHIPGGAEGAWYGVEARRNQELVRGQGTVFTLWDANWLLTARGLERARTPEHRSRGRYALRILHPRRYALGVGLRKAQALARRIPAGVWRRARRLLAGTSHSNTRGSP
jgi:hypothetical protein